MSEPPLIYAIIWDVDGLPYLFDVESYDEAVRASIWLAEHGRENIRIVGPREVEISADALKRCSERIQRKVDAEAELSILLKEAGI